MGGTEICHSFLGFPQSAPSLPVSDKGHILLRGRKKNTHSHTPLSKLKKIYIYNASNCIDSKYTKKTQYFISQNRVTSVLAFLFSSAPPPPPPYTVCVSRTAQNVDVGCVPWVTLNRDMIGHYCPLLSMVNDQICPALILTRSQPQNR